MSINQRNGDASCLVILQEFCRVLDTCANIGISDVEPLTVSRCRCYEKGG
jgi:hypothetical protein